MTDAEMDLSWLEVMIVDDNAYMRDLVKQVLRGFGIQSIREAANGREAYQALADKRSHVVICDIEMTPVHGLELVHRIRRGVPPDGLDITTQPDPHTPVIMLTSHAKQSLVAKAKDVHVNGFLVKPVNPKHMRQRLEKIAPLIRR